MGIEITPTFVINHKKKILGLPDVRRERERERGEREFYEERDRETLHPHGCSLLHLRHRLERRWNGTD
jgi:hypothetical protein